MTNYRLLTPDDVACALAIEDCDEMTGKQIARDMLAGVVEFTCDELIKLAEYKGVTAGFLMENDPAFSLYTDPATAARKSIALNLLRRGADYELAAEICGLPLDTVRNLI